MADISPVSAARALPQDARAQLREKAQQLESAFLSEMLGYAGFGKTRDSFGGGIGEDQFASFLREAQAKSMVRAGGIGLSESLFQALVKGLDDNG